VQCVLRIIAMNLITVRMSKQTHVLYSHGAQYCWRHRVMILSRHRIAVQVVKYLMININYMYSVTSPSDRNYFQRLSVKITWSSFDDVRQFHFSTITSLASENSHWLCTQVAGMSSVHHVTAASDGYVAYAKTRAPETGARKLMSVSGAGFSHQLQKFLSPETNMDE